ncbi:o-succinylbenzoate synthase [Tistrella bauzanensis]|uniref:o-succinylbenzoate synthase n=1 Tax=Tistrella bauzanensis TaxID=657419 RepID=A0ABQ1IT93_9PROT|nr:o-succinylbenzoate synthase [Tistrella bauzanensis]GGB48920.1 o-succinylbenzoate synthase [Tistrella bauzanensis]
MRIDGIVLRFVSPPMAAPFANRWQRMERWTKLLVEIRAEGLSGWGECTAMEAPFYHYETIETAWTIIERHLAPMLVGTDVDGPADMLDRFRDISGHVETIAALEVALHDLIARRDRLPLAVAIGGSLRPVKASATIGVTGDAGELVAAARRAMEAGYHRVKVKIKPGWDTVPLAALKADLPEMPVLADANGAYGPEALDHLSTFDRFGLMLLEQPLAAHNWKAYASLQARLDTTICLDESIHTMEDVDELLDRRAARAVNLKVGRVGGLTAARAMHDRLMAAGIGCFTGAKFETGVGRWTNIALATLPGMTYASDVAESARYFRPDITATEVELVAPGMVAPLDAPGIGTVPEAERLSRYTTRVLRIGD